MQTIRDETLKYPTLETGGALFGWRDANQCVIACAGDPGPRARHRPYSFEADRRHNQSLINRIHQKSQGRYRFLGSWHSHPGTRITPSIRDSTTAQEIATEALVDLSEPLVLIISQARAAIPREDPAKVVCCCWWSQHLRRLAKADLRMTCVVDKWC